MDGEEIESYKKAGEIAIQVKAYAREIIKPGMKLIDIARLIDDKIIELGGELGFPVNLCIDEIAAHYTPVTGDEYVVSGLLTFDVGVTINGYFADTAFSMDFSEDSRYKDMIECNRSMLDAVMGVVSYGMRVHEVGEAATNALESWNKKHETKYNLIDGLSGHQVAKDIIHAGFTIPNYRNDMNTIIKDTGFASESFITKGSGKIKSGLGGGIYSIDDWDKKVRDPDSRKVLEYVKENFKTRPFCMRWVERGGFNRLRFVFMDLEKQGIFYQYPLLIETSGTAVSQMENTFLAAENEILVTTKD
ncbi:MAG: type II methionyl aminopeptidase [Nanoarchaeota archaeon]|nr:type II methionyl aminopeptidase [Nanoarchaeota archaeon]